MYILDVTPNELYDALKLVNATFEGNIDSQVTPSGFGIFNVSLHAKDINGPGHRLAHPAIHGGIPINLVTACWHVHYTLFKHLPQRSSVKKDGILYPVRGQKFPVWTIDRGGTPILITELCECSHPKRYVNPVLGQHDWRKLYTPVDSTKSRRNSGRQGSYVNHDLYG